MNLVFAKTKELGEALMMSDEYKAMKEAEEKAMGNGKAAYTMGQMIECRQKIEEMLSKPDPDSEQLRVLSEKMEDLQAELQENEDISALTEARNKFSALIENVNKLLRFVVTGEMEHAEGEDCTGNCSTCGGSCHLN